MSGIHTIRLEESTIRFVHADGRSATVTVREKEDGVRTVWAECYGPDENLSSAIQGISSDEDSMAAVAAEVQEHLDAHPFNSPVGQIMVLLVFLPITEFLCDNCTELNCDDCPDTTIKTLVGPEADGK